MYRAITLFVSVCLVAACAHAPAGAPCARPTPAGVVAWADLDGHLGAVPVRLPVGLADGRAVLGDCVTMLNGAETAAFVARHGYAGLERRLAVRRTASTLEVDVEIRGRDGTAFVVKLYADGALQGAG